MMMMMIIMMIMMMKMMCQRSEQHDVRGRGSPVPWRSLRWLVSSKLSLNCHSSCHSWYQGTEVASRDFLDPQRYNLLYPLGEAMGLDMSSNATLWKVRPDDDVTKCTG